MTLSLPVDELYVVGGVVGFVSGGGGIEIGGDVLLSRASDQFRQRTFNKATSAGRCRARVDNAYYLSFVLPAAAAAASAARCCSRQGQSPDDPRDPPTPSSCAASPPPPHPTRRHPVRPPNGTRTDAVPHPSKGGESYAPEVRDQVGRVMLGASVRPGIQINKSSRHYSSPV